MSKYNHDWFMEKVKEKRPKDYKEYQFIGKYVNAKTYIETIHNICGETVMILPNTFISRGSCCPKCARKIVHKKQLKSAEEYKGTLDKNLTLLTPYKGAHEKVSIHCSICDNTYDIRARDVAKRGCSHCKGGRFKRTLDDIVKEVYEVTGGEYEVLSKTYKNANTPITLIHHKCNNEYDVSMNNFRKNKRCPRCKESKGERLISSYLKKENKSFEQQKTYEDLKNVRSLSYDFYLEEYNLLIEYQGEQHYKPIKLFGGEEQLQLQKKLDKIKRDYATKNGITLVEIPYTVTTEKELNKLLTPHLNIS